MMHKPIQINDLDFSFSHKTCFENFSCHIPYGSRIAIIGRNGSGKSTLLKMIASRCDEDVRVGYVPQVITDHTDLSGGQRVNKAVTEALSRDPNVLLLDEPTNHLDNRNRKSLLRLLQNYSGTLLVVSHDKELLRHCTDTLWHIDNGKIHIFSGKYDDYVCEMKLKRASMLDHLALLNRQKKCMHHKLMQEQERSSKSKAKGKKKSDQRKWSAVVSGTKAGKAEETSGRKKAAIDKRKSELTERLNDLRLPEIIVPKFSLESSEVGRGMVVQLSDASVGYSENPPVLSGITLSLQSGERIALIGDNGTGKSTLIKAILGESGIYKTGEWHVIKRDAIGYLDQHYGTLDPEKTVLESIEELAPHMSHAEIRRHLNDFLFRKNEEVHARVSTLSGGEKARLSLAHIAANTPKLLILDEITNNLDLETKDHVAQVLSAYPGAMMIISHDRDFLQEIGVTMYCEINDGYAHVHLR